VTLVHERVVVERRRPRIDKISGEMLTELTVEVVETDEVPVIGKTVRMKEEVVVRRERTEHVETVRDTITPRSSQHIRLPFSRPTPIQQKAVKLLGVKCNQ
jgi:hypothetical protein